MSLSLSELFQQSLAGATRPQNQDENVKIDDVSDSGEQNITEQEITLDCLSDIEGTTRQTSAGETQSRQSESRSKRRKRGTARTDDEDSFERPVKLEHKRGDSSDSESDNNETASEVSDLNRDHRSMDRDAFYGAYPQRAQTLYRFQTTENQNEGVSNEEMDHSESLETIRTALFPSIDSEALARVSNGRRLAGENETTTETGEDPFSSKSLRGRYRPRKKRVRAPGSSGKKEVSFRLETQEEIKDRVRRLEGYNERSMIRARWKQRSINFQSEEDVGNAFFTRAEESLAEQLRTEEEKHYSEERKKRKREEKQRAKEERKRAREIELSDDLEEDDEVKEQTQFLALLSQQNNVVVPKEEGGEPDLSTKIPEELDYWQKGYSMPPMSLTAFDTNSSVKKIVHGSTKIHSKEMDKEGNATTKEIYEIEAKASLSALMEREDANYRGTRFFFQPNRTLVTNANSTFRPGYKIGHVQHLLSMAARTLCGGGGARSIEEMDLENTYFCLLCTREADFSTKRKRDAGPSICAKFRTKGYLAAFCEEQGKNMLLYVQNSWDDPVEVAKQLGIFDPSQNSPIQGNLLCNLKYHSKKIRTRAKKSHKIRSTHWDYEDDNANGNEYQDRDRDDDSMAIADGTNIIPPEVTTSAGIMDAMTAETTLTTNKKQACETSHEKDALVSPTSLYCHIAGTCPPIPHFPLDPSNCIFGPVDRHSMFYHGHVMMDESVYKIVLSAMMRRIHAARSLEENSILLKTQEQVQNLAKGFANANENKFYLLYTNFVQNPTSLDVPLVPFYRGVIGYCSFLANMYVEMQHLDSTHDYNDDGTMKLKREDEDELPHLLGMSLVAEKIWDFCRPNIRHNGFMRFPKLKITYGIALICRSLPSSAAEILSRPIDKDNDVNCTPLTLFRQTLEELENKKSITSNRHFDDPNVVRAVELEFLFHDAAEFFLEAVKLDPTNVDYQLWHIGCLASCLLISSGNKISNDVHVLPSEKSGNFRNHDNADHEIRHCLKKYYEVRIELATAVKALLTLTKYQESSGAHFAVLSLLEWGQVIGLMVGRTIEAHLEDIRNMHNFHLGEWIKKEPFLTVQEREEKGTAGSDAIIRAKILENNPEEIQNWRNFVRCLEPVIDTTGMDRGTDWWGKNRRWWADHLLNLPVSDCDTYTQASNFNVVVSQLLRDVDRSRVSPSKISYGFSNEDKEASRHIASDNPSWLPSRESMETEDENSESLKRIRTTCFANHLPRRNRKIRKASNSRFQCESASAAPLLCSSESVEVLAYKILIFSHLFDADHPSIRQGIYGGLILNGLKDGGREQIDRCSDEFLALSWLISMGVDIEKITTH